MKTFFSNKVNLLCLVWAIPVLHFLINPSYNLSSLPTWISFSLSIFIIIKNKNILPLSIPFIALLSPLAVNGKFLNLLPSELFLLGLFFMGVLVFLVKRKTTINLLSGDSYLIALLVLVLISFIASLEYQTLLKSLFSWIMISTVFCLTRLFIKSKESINSYFIVIMVCIFYSTIITLVSFYNGLILPDFIQSGIYDKQEMQYDTYKFYLRGTFFYTNIGYIIAPAVIISLMHSINSAIALHRFLYGALFVLFLFLLFLMAEKTGLVALSIALIFLLSINYITPRIKRKKFKLIKFIFITSTPFIVYAVYGFIDSLSRYNLSVGGFSQRLCVFNSTFEVLIQNPLRFLFGFGPDSSVLLDNKFTKAAKANCTGGFEGAIDSGHMTFLFEYGFIFAIIFILYLIHCFLNVYKKIKVNFNQKTFYVMLLGIIVYIAFAALTDVVGTSKVTWVISQFFAIIAISTSYNFNRTKNEMKNI